MNIRKQLPVLDVKNFVDAPCFIVAFYEALGWNSDTQELDPRKILIHEETWGHICEQLIAEGGRVAGLSWMNFGPAADESNEYKLDKHEVKILKGAFGDVNKQHVQAS